MGSSLSPYEILGMLKDQHASLNFYLSLQALFTKCTTSVTWPAYVQFVDYIRSIIAHTGVDIHQVVSHAEMPTLLEGSSPCKTPIPVVRSVEG